VTHFRSPEVDHATITIATLIDGAVTPRQPEGTRARDHLG